MAPDLRGGGPGSPAPEAHPTNQKRLNHHHTNGTANGSLMPCGDISGVVVTGVVNLDVGE